MVDVDDSKLAPVLNNSPIINDNRMAKTNKNKKNQPTPCPLPEGKGIKSLFSRKGIGSDKEKPN